MFMVGDAVEIVVGCSSHCPVKGHKGIVAETYGDYESLVFTEAGHGECGGHSGRDGKDSDHHCMHDVGHLVPWRDHI